MVEEEVLRGKVTENMRDAVFEVATAANDHVLTARGLATSAPPEVRRAFAGLVRHCAVRSWARLCLATN